MRVVTDFIELVGSLLLIGSKKSPNDFRSSSPSLLSLFFYFKAPSANLDFFLATNVLQFKICFAAVLSTDGYP